MGLAVRFYVLDLNFKQIENFFQQVWQLFHILYPNSGIGGHILDWQQIKNLNLNQSKIIHKLNFKPIENSF